MDPILRLQLFRTSCSLAGRFLSFDEKLRIGSPDFSKTTKSGMMIRSYQYPEIQKGTIWLPGDDPTRDDTVFQSFTWGESMEDFISRIVSSLKEFLEEELGCKITIDYYENGIMEYTLYSGRTQAFTEE